jgi:biotin carboxyl carrier protein
MSALSGSIGKRKIRWKKAPVGIEGSSEVEVDGKTYAVAWRRDAEGLWLEMPHGTFGFDFTGEVDESAGGLTYRMSERGSDRLAYGLRVRGEGESAASGATKKKGVRVRAQMPGKIVRILVKAGDEVVRDQPLLVMEAMKMENEIRAQGAGKIEAIKVSEGQAVESGADLISIG